MLVSIAAVLPAVAILFLSIMLVKRGTNHLIPFFITSVIIVSFVALPTTYDNLRGVSSEIVKFLLVHIISFIALWLVLLGYTVSTLLKKEKPRENPEDYYGIGA